MRHGARAASTVVRAAMVAALATTATGCGATVVPLVEAEGAPLTVTPSPAIPLEVRTRATGVPDPLRVDGSRAAFAEVEDALGHAVSSATVPWAASRAGRAPEGGWQLTVELVEARAEHHDGRTLVTLGTRATLRERLGNRYVGQTIAACRQGALVPAERASPVMFDCMRRIGRDLAGWLAGLPLPSTGS